MQLTATPDHFHFQDLTDAIDHGLHAFAEKPLAVTASEVESLRGELGRASKKGLVVSSCHPRRYDPPFHWMKENIDRLAEESGRPLEFWFDFSYHKPSKDWKHDRGLLLDHANHEIDLLHYLFGHTGFNATKLADSPINYRVEGTRDDGLKFKFSGSRRLESHKYLEWTGVRFERGDLIVDAHIGIARIQTCDQTRTIDVGSTDYESRGRGVFIPHRIPTKV